MTDKLARFVTEKAAYVVIVLLAITMVPLYYASKGLSINVVLEEMYPSDSKNVELFKRFSEQFGGANLTLVEVKNNNGTIYDTDYLKIYKKIAEDIYYHEDTQRHLNQSLVLRKTKVIKGGGGRVEVTALLWPDLPQNAEEMAGLKKAVNAQYRGFQVSDDETSAIILADFKEGIDFEETLAFFDEIRAQYEGDNFSINYVGRPILLGEIYRALDSVLVIGLCSLAIIILILYFYFRCWIGVFVPLFTATVASIWGLGAMGFVSYNLDPLLILLPGFIFAIVLSHGVQLTTRILDHLSDGGEPAQNNRNVTKNALAGVLVPSTGAIVTDAAGFAVLALAAIPSIKSLAIICSLWLLSVGPSLIFASAAMALLPVPKKYRTGSSYLNHFWTKVVSIEDHKYVVIGVVVLLLGLGLFYSQNLTIGDTKGNSILWPDSRFNSDSESINTRYSFLGTDVMQVYVEGDANTMLDPAVFHEIELLDRYIYEHVSEARPAQSLVPIIKSVNSVLYEGDPSYAILPDTEEEIGFDIYMFRSRGEPGDFAAFTNNEWEIGNISFYLEDHSAQTIDKLSQRLKQFFKEFAIGGSSAEFLFSGGQVGLTEALNTELQKTNVNIMIAITIVIFFCVIALYRSVKVAIILLVSLAAANAITYAFMAWKGVGLNISSLPLAALGVGLGVDYGIYMIDRIKEEYRKCGDMIDAMHRALMTSGNAIVITALSMTAPLIPWIFFSDLRFHAEMSMLLSLVLFMNMLGSLLFVPAALCALKPKEIFRDQDNRSTDESGQSAVAI